MRRTRLEFGGLGQVKEDCRESRGTTLLETTVLDVRYALPPTAQDTRLHANSSAHASPGHRSQRSDFHLGECRPAEEPPRRRPEDPGAPGDRNDCCVGYGVPDDGDYSLFSTDAYKQLKKSAPEFEDLAAMQAGFAPRPVIARRDGTQESARSVVGEFVSGNYFHTFGLKPFAGRLLSDADDVEGAPLVAVMSYATWKNDYAGDPAIVGSTYFMNTRPVTIARNRTRGVLWGPDVQHTTGLLSAH